MIGVNIEERDSVPFKSKFGCIVLERLLTFLLIETFLNFSESIMSLNLGITSHIWSTGV